MLKLSAASVALAAALSLSLTSGVAEARGKHRQHRSSVHATYARQPQRQVCVKECENDSSPCDPYYFKHADGRCNFDNW